MTKRNVTAITLLLLFGWAFFAAMVWYREPWVLAPAVLFFGIEIIYCGVLLIKEQKVKLPKDLQDSFYAPWPTLNDLIQDGSVTVTPKEATHE